jgi:uncharacterized membrane protein
MSMKTFHRRSIAKAISWRVVATLTTFAIVYVLTGKLALAMEVGIFDVTLKMLFYYIHERSWDKVSWGQLKHPLSEITVKKELSSDDMDIIRQKLKDLGYM